MAGTLVETPINGAADWTDFVEQVDAMKLGFSTVVISHYDDTSEPKVQAGSWVEIKGALYKFTAEESITGWAGIGNNTDCYIKFVPAGSTVTVEFTTDSPTYTPSSGGWYDSDDRFIGGLHRGVSSAAYEDKWLYQTPVAEYGAARVLGNGEFEFNDDVAITGTLGVSGITTISSQVRPTGVKPTGTLNVGSPSQDTVFHALEAAIPNTNDICIVAGIMGSGFVTAYAIRATSSRVDFYTANEGASRSVLQANDGQGATFASSVVIAW